MSQSNKNISLKGLLFIVTIAMLALVPLSGAGAAGADSDVRYVAYYFYGDQRCASCKTIEAYAEETVQRDFGAQLQSGKLEWLTVNAMDNDNQHFLYDFSLTNQTVVLVEISDDQRLKWKRLDRVWQLLRDKKAFQTYVSDEISAFMKD
jgi:hypothetical protein